MSLDVNIEWIVSGPAGVSSNATSPEAKRLFEREAQRMIKAIVAGLDRSEGGTGGFREAQVGLLRLNVLNAETLDDAFEMEWSDMPRFEPGH